MKIYILSASALLAFNAAAITVENVAGSLSSHPVAELNQNQLVITGTMNAADFDYLLSNNFTNPDDKTKALGNLRVLDLSNVSIVEYNGDPVLSGISQSPANVLPSYALAGLQINRVVFPSSITSIGEGALSSTAITAIAGSSSTSAPTGATIIPASVTSVGDNAFANNTALVYAEIPSSVTRLGNSAFLDCSALKTTLIYSQLETLGDRMFEGCSSLTDVSLQNTVKTIGSQAFMYCSALKEISFPKALTEIKSMAFYGSGLNHIYMSGSKSLSSIGDFAFAKCTSLEDVTFGSESIDLGEGVFFDDTALVNINLPASTTVIPSYTFKGTESIDYNRAIPSSVTEIGDYALTGWSNIDSFNLPANIEKIGNNAMQDWSFNPDSKEIIFHAETLDKAPALGSDVWKNMPEKVATLMVKNDDALQNFSADPQWSNAFVIKTKETTGVDDIIGETSAGDANTAIDFYFIDKTLVIASKGDDIVSVDIYDLNGKRRMGKKAKGKSVEIDTSSWSNLLIIADVRLADNSHAAIKIKR